MSNIKEIIIFQKKRLEESLEYYKELIDNFDNSANIYNQELLESIEKNDNLINEININFDIIQYHFDLSIIDKNSIEKKRIENYQIQEKILKLFTPYMIYMRLMMKSKNE